MLPGSGARKMPMTRNDAQVNPCVQVDKSFGRAITFVCDSRENVDENVNFLTHEFGKYYLGIIARQFNQMERLTERLDCHAAWGRSFLDILDLEAGVVYFGLGNLHFIAAGGFLAKKNCRYHFPAKVDGRRRRGRILNRHVSFPQALPFSRCSDDNLQGFAHPAEISFVNCGHANAFWSRSPRQRRLCSARLNCRQHESAQYQASSTEGHTQQAAAALDAAERGQILGYHCWFDNTALFVK